MASANQHEVLPAPSDGVSQLRIQSNRFLLASSWDSQVRLYDISSNTLKASYSHKAAVLDCVFASDRLVTYSGGIDREVKSFEINTESEQVLGQHEKTIRCVEFSSTTNTLYSGSWDATVKQWDPRQKSALVDTYNVEDRVFTMSLNSEKLVVGTANRQILIFDLRNMSEPLQKRESSLKYQTRTVSCNPNGSGYVLGSIEGRVAVEYFDPQPEIQSKKYAFKCHRQMVNGIDVVYPVNAISFNPVYGTFATGGSDGLVCVWDGENRKRLSQYARYPTGVSALAFSEDGTMLAVASSYTFEEGEKDVPPDQIFIRYVNEVEVKPKARTA
eukprot:TRINITY_DN1757_c0_g1_i1.p1 TRINITY_DN1757_c0_g1~~TRINITY_DN1757_c0_g1_i1.p1  ORF type:complete len:329 (+),score=101.50 TRINITY_DN1757_c0_g1_i1:1147-2133(+)